MRFPSSSLAVLKTNPLLSAATLPLLVTLAIDESIGAHVALIVLVKSSIVNLLDSPTLKSIASL